MKLTPDDIAQMECLWASHHGLRSGYEAIALHFLRAGIERSLKAITERVAQTPYEAVRALLED